MWYSQTMNKETNDQGADKPPAKRRKSLAEKMAAAAAREAKAVETLRRRKVKLQKYQAQQRSLERRLDTRRKIIAGALALEHMKRGGAFRATMLELLDEYVVKDDERVLFALEALAADDPRRTQAATAAAPAPAPR